LSEIARVTLLPDPQTGPITPSGPVRSIQEAEIELPLDAFRKLWRAEHLERLAGAYWAYLSKVTLRLIKVVYEPDARTVVLVGRRLPLLRFHRPEYEAGAGSGQVTWRIDRGLLVAGTGHGEGMLRITVRSEEPALDSKTATIMVRTEVANFYPLLRGAGRFARIGVRIYNATQLRLHVWITHGFLRSLARLDLPPSPVGALAAPEDENQI